MVDLSSYDTDKSEKYLERYTKEFGHLFTQKIALLELGIHRGGSLQLWRDMFPNGMIAGLDIHQVPVPDDSGRIHVFQGFQQDTQVLDRIAAEVAPTGFDIVVDDASHLGEYTRDAFWHLFLHHLKPGGIYVIDDWGAAYFHEWPDGHRYVGSREALGDFASNRKAGDPGVSEKLRRITSRDARPFAARIPQKLRTPLRKIFTAATLETRIRSHDYGIVGFVKQLVDAVAINDIDRHEVVKARNAIESIHVYESQIFIWKELG